MHKRCQCAWGMVCVTTALVTPIVWCLASGRNVARSWTQAARGQVVKDLEVLAKESLPLSVMQPSGPVCCSEPMVLFLGTQVAAESGMAFVLISWVSMSVLFCLALVRAAARRHVPNGNSIEKPVSASRPGALLRARVAQPQPISATTPL